MCEQPRRWWRLIFWLALYALGCLVFAILAAVVALFIAAIYAAFALAAVIVWLVIWIIERLGWKRSSTNQSIGSGN